MYEILKERIEILLESKTKEIIPKIGEPYNYFLIGYKAGLEKVLEMIK